MKKILITALILFLILAIFFYITSREDTVDLGSSNPTGQQQIIEEVNEVYQQNIAESELSAHNNRSDCWISYQGKVYDITSYLSKHPGGAESIQQFCGTTSKFEVAFTNQHGASQVEKLLLEGIFKGNLN
jgi:cytochrome b involved in lipid metabolism